MTIVQDFSEVGPLAQAAMFDPWANYKLSVQTAYATSLEQAFLLFDGTLIVQSVWMPGVEPYQTRGRPTLAIVDRE